MHERLVARLAATVDHLLDQPAVAPHVHLEPSPAVTDPGDLLDRPGRHRRQRVRQPRPLGRPGDGQLALGIGDAGETRRRQHQRERQRLAEQRRRRVDVSDRPQHTGPELDAGEGIAVVAQRLLVLGAAVDVVEHAARQTPLGDPPEVVDRGGRGQPPLHRVELDPPEAHHRAQRVDDLHDVKKPRSAEAMRARASALDSTTSTIVSDVCVCPRAVKPSTGTPDDANASA